MLPPCWGTHCPHLGSASAARCSKQATLCSLAHAGWHASLPLASVASCCWGCWQRVHAPMVAGGAIHSAGNEMHVVIVCSMLVDMGLKYRRPVSVTRPYSSPCGRRVLLGLLCGCESV